MDRSSPISYMVQDTASIQSFLHMIVLRVLRPGVDRPLFTGKEVLNLQRRSWTRLQVTTWMFLPGKERCNVLKRQHMDKGSKIGSGRMVWDVCQALSLWGGISRHGSSSSGNFTASCESNWSAHWHIHFKVCKRLAPATTEKPVYIYSNWKAVAAEAYDDTLKICVWDNEWCAALLAGASLSRMCTHSSCVCKRAQYHTLSRQMSLCATLHAQEARASEARVRYARKQVLYTTRARRAALERDSWAC